MGPIQNKMKKRESCCAADFGQGARDKNGTEKRGADQPWEVTGIGHWGIKGGGSGQGIKHVCRMKIPGVERNKKSGKNQGSKGQKERTVLVFSGSESGGIKDSGWKGCGCPIGVWEWHRGTAGGDAFVFHHPSRKQRNCVHRRNWCVAFYGWIWDLVHVRRDQGRRMEEGKKKAINVNKQSILSP